MYKTTCLKTGKFYIGVHSADDINDDYLGSGLRLKASIKKHGRNNHSREILETFETRAEAFARENEVVNAELMKNPFCMNLAAGGVGIKHPPVFSAEHRKKISAALKGRKMSPESIEKMASKLRGRKHTSEACANMSAAQRGKKRPKISAALKGRKMSEEQKKKISATLTGKKHLVPRKHRKKRGPAWNKGRPGRPLSDEHKAKIAAALNRKGKGKGNDVL